MTRDERIILSLTRQVEDLRTELKDAKKQSIYNESARRDRTITEALDTLDEYLSVVRDNTEASKAFWQGVEEARAKVRALYDRPMPLMCDAAVPQEAKAAA